MTKMCGNALRAFAAAFIVGLLTISGAAAQSGNPIRIGMSLALTGAGASPSKVINTALEIWRDDVNAKGGLLGRPVELVIYDDQSTPANVPEHLHQADHRRQGRPAARALRYELRRAGDADHHREQEVDDQLHGDRHQRQIPLSDKYFSMVSVGPEGVNSFSIGFFDMAAAQKPKPETVAILAADAEFAQGAAQGAREEIKKHGFKLVYDKSYPPSYHRLRAGGARGPGHQSRHRLYRRLSAG